MNGKVLSVSHDSLTDTAGYRSLPNLEKLKTEAKVL